ncbi:unnamed protein product [Miscanthus lutarioriparius]|uniref:Uncharacterized protein n=1 Tax=Miscanthus lutarioriparius TaxID=422564 RepID=A0A811QX93_9POAL|nr:unnamed protein product [Miscanthus lutarioriparius]
MGAWPRPGKAKAPAPRSLLRALALCCLLAQLQPQPSRAFFFGVRTSAHVPQHRGGGREEKVPMTVVVPDYSPRPAPLGPSPSPSPVPGMDGSGGDDEDGTPRLPSERRSTGAGAPWSADHSATAQAPAGATSADFISSSPAVPLPAGVTDSATVLPMPTPGRQQLRDDVGMGTLRLQVRAAQLSVPLLMMLSFWG